MTSFEVVAVSTTGPTRGEALYVQAADTLTEAVATAKRVEAGGDHAIVRAVVVLYRTGEGEHE